MHEHFPVKAYYVCCDRLGNWGKSTLNSHAAPVPILLCLPPWERRRSRISPQMARDSCAVQTSFFSAVMLVSTLSCGQGNCSFLEVCWETGHVYGEVTPEPGSAVQVQGQTQDTLASLKGEVVAASISQRHHSRHVECAVQ